MSARLSELLQTEFHHVRTLRIMEGVYRRGMQEEVMLEAGVVHTIFPCLDQLLEWHSTFLSELLKRRKEGLLEGSNTNFTVGRIGDLLLTQVSTPLPVQARRRAASCGRELHTWPHARAHTHKWIHTHTHTTVLLQKCEDTLKISTLNKRLLKE